MTLDENSSTNLIKDCYQVMQNACGIKVGDRVRLLRIAKSYEMGWPSAWPGLWDEDLVKQLIERIATVKSINSTGIYIFFDNTMFGAYVPWFVLEKIEEPKVNSIFISIRKESCSDRQVIEFKATNAITEEIERIIRENA